MNTTHDQGNEHDILPSRCVNSKLPSGWDMMETLDPCHLGSPSTVIVPMCSHGPSS